MRNFINMIKTIIRNRREIHERYIDITEEKEIFDTVEDFWDKMKEEGIIVNKPQEET